VTEDDRLSKIARTVSREVSLLAKAQQDQASGLAKLLQGIAEVEARLRKLEDVSPNG